MGNQLTTLDVSDKTELGVLYCSDNPLTSLDVSNNDLLEVLFCRNNQLSSLDISFNLSLTDLDCGRNNLTSLDISNNTNLGTNIWESIPDIVLDSMPTLNEVCVWVLPFPPEGVETDTTASPNLYFTMDCSQ
jgi:Leucine-rich repeat (LRR) protein